MPNSVGMARTYHQSYQGSPADSYVTARGLAGVAALFGLGYVDSAIPGHERYRRHLVIPYLRPAGGDDGVATLRFRCIDDRCTRDADGIYHFLKGQKEQHEGHGKYQSLPGDPPRLFNTSALIQTSADLVMVEGEFDTMTWALAGIPAVGPPGTGTWRDYWAPAFYGYENVYLIAEDSAGMTFMDSLAAKMPNGKVIELGGSDSNAIYLAEGLEALKRRIGK